MMPDQSEKTELLGNQPVRRDSMQRIIARGGVFHAFLCVLIALGCFINLEILPSDKGSFFLFFSALPGNGRLPEIISVTVLLYIVSRYCCKDYAWRNHRLVKCLVSLFFSLTMVFGWAFAFHNSAYLLFSGGVQCCKTLFSLAAWFSVSYLCISALLEALPSLHEHLCSVSNQSLLLKIGAVFRKHPFSYASVALNVIWLPALIGYFPGLFTWDTPQQIYMWFNMPNYHSSLLNLINSEITLSQHHPVLHTALLGLCVQLGQLLGNESFGVGVFTFLQYEGTIFVIAYSMVLLNRIDVPKALIMILFCFYVFVPIFPLFANLVVKDSLFGALLLAFVSLCFSMVQTEKPPSKGWIILAVIAALLSLMRNGALLFSLVGIVVLVITRPQWKKQVAICTLSVLVVSLSFTSILLPALQITPGSKREVLSIPFQQVARYAVEHPDEIVDEDRAAINTILEFDTLASRYDPSLSDKVKDKFNENASKEEMQRFWFAWVNLGLTHPETYLSATANNYYGYFYLTDYDPELYTKSYSMGCMNKMEGFDIHASQNLFSDVCGLFDTLYQKLIEMAPLVKTTIAPPLYVWALIILTMVCIAKRRREGIVLLTVPWLVLLVNLIGPANGYAYFRYTYPIALCVPFMLGVVLTLCGRESDSKQPTHDKL